MFNLDTNKEKLRIGVAIAVFNEHKFDSITPIKIGEKYTAFHRSTALLSRKGNVKEWINWNFIILQTLEFTEDYSEYFLSGSINECEKFDLKEEVLEKLEKLEKKATQK